MPIPRKLLHAAFESLSEKTLRKIAEHVDRRGRPSSESKDVLCKKLSRDDGTNLQSYTGYLTTPELKSIAGVFALEAKGKTKNELDAAIWGFVQDYDKIARKLTYDDVFANPRGADFTTRLREWMAARHSTKKLSELSDGEKVLWEIQYAQMDINGNSFPGVFEGGQDDRPEAFVRALNEIGAKKSAKAFQEIGRILFEGEVPKTRKARSKALTDDDDDSETLDERVEACRQIWDKTGEDIASLTVKFAAKNAKRFQS